MIRGSKIPSWLWQSRIVFTQTNAAAGAMKVDYSAASGQVIRLVSADAVNSGNNSLLITVRDEDNAAHINILANISAAAGTRACLPSIGSVATTTANSINSKGLLLLPGQKLCFEEGAAGAQNDTLTIALGFLLYHLATEPTISKARSTNAADVTQGTDSISDANDLVFAGLVDHI